MSILTETSFTEMTRVEQMAEIQKKGLDLFRRKNADYGDAFATYGAIGVLVRMGDKIHRLMSISAKGIRVVDDESMADTLLDLHNYSAMALMLIEEEKSKMGLAGLGEGGKGKEGEGENEGEWGGEGAVESETEDTF
jgi:hypothetical protein